MDRPYLFGLSKDGTIGLLLGFGISTFVFLGIFWVDGVIKHVKQKWGK